MMPCKICGGTGKVHICGMACVDIDCQDCNGTGKVPAQPDRLAALEAVAVAARGVVVLSAVPFAGTGIDNDQADARMKALATALARLGAGK